MKSLIRLLAALLATTVGWSYTYIYVNDDPTMLPLKWPPGTVPVRIMLGTDKTLTDGSTYNSSAQAAAEAWNAVLGDLKFQPQSVAPGAAGNGNGVNELAFGSDLFGRAFGSGVLAVTTTLTDRSGNVRAEADTIFDSKDWTWDSFRGQRSGTAQDLQRVAIHELGHSLGLDHPNQAGQSVTAIMNSTISNVDALVADDITGAQNLYGPAPQGSKPANDDFASATTIPFDSSSSTKVNGFTTNATKEPGEPDHAGNAGGHSIWWKWTPQVGGSVTIDTKGSYADTTLAVYTGTALSALATIASNDDIKSGVIQASTVTFSATAGTTYMIAVDGFDGDSAGITLNLSITPVAAAPVITTQPANQTVTVGDSASLSVAAIGSGTLSYQWFFGGTALSGATGATLSLTNVQTTNAGSYSVTITNSVGSVTSNTATLTVNAAIPLAITTQPVSQTVTAGTNVSFSVVATGSGTLTYQWFFGTVALTGATGATLNLNGVQTADAGSYHATVSNTLTSVTSNSATLTVNSPVVTQPTPTSSGGGGGGATSDWFVAALSVLGIGRLLRNRR